jgi:5S rRNA maturation endonuclease (ribonuclease M5)
MVGLQLQAHCPFPENHSQGDKKPSFSAKIDGDGTSPYICFGCHVTGALEGLAIKNGWTDLVPDWKPKKVSAKKNWFYRPRNNAAMFSHLYRRGDEPVYFLDDYLKPLVGKLSWYFKQRGITLETAQGWELGVDKVNNRATFTVRDYKGRLAMVVGRDVTDRSMVKYSNYSLDTMNGALVPFIDHERKKDFRSPTKKFFLYGEHMAWKVFTGEMTDRKSRDLIVVEGQMDVLQMWQYGWNAVCTCGSMPSEQQCEKMIMFIPPGARLICLPDGDAAGLKMVQRMKDLIKGRVSMYYAELGADMDPGDASDDEINETISNARLF